ncbi:hypothetical protein KAJ77_03410, partial [bacterium]|nr:hypothetical protein [bacterium]
FDPDGSLATTHESQGTDMGLFSGFLGWDTTDERLTNSLRGKLTGGNPLYPISNIGHRSAGPLGYAFQLPIAHGFAFR